MTSKHLGFLSFKNLKPQKSKGLKKLAKFLQIVTNFIYLNHDL